MTLPVRPIAADAVDQDATPAELDLGPASVVAYRLHDAESLHPGSPFTLDLTLRANRDLEPTGGVVAVSGDGAAAASQAFTLAPGGGIDKGDLFCQRLRLRVPTAIAGVAAPERLDVSIELDGQEQRDAGEVLTTIEISAAPPAPTTAPAIPLNARLGDDMALSGATVLRPSKDSLQIDLLWEALNNPQWPSKAFVQLLGPDGGLVAQSDAVPAGLATSKWVSGTTYVDSHTLTLPEAVASGEYTVVAGLYDDLSLVRLPATDDAGSRLAEDAVPISTLHLPQ
jgi:hypothetical protein